MENTMHFELRVTENKEEKTESENEVLKIAWLKWDLKRFKSTFNQTKKHNDSFWERYCRQVQTQRWGWYSQIQTGRDGRWNRLLGPCRTTPSWPAGTAGSVLHRHTVASGSAWVALEAGWNGCPPHTQREIHPYPYLQRSLWTEKGFSGEKSSRSCQRVLLQRGCGEKKRLETQRHVEK